MLSPIQIATTAIVLLSLISISGALLFYGVYLTMDKVNRLWAEQLNEERESAAVQIGKEIELEAHWFSESPEVYAALLIIGRQIQHDHFFAASSDREAWRDAMREQNKDE